MKFFQSLTNRFLLFISGLMAVFMIGSLLITSSVVKSGMVDLFRQRLERVDEVLDQYARVRYYSQTTELEAVLSSPRFSAAVETADSATIAREAPFYRSILNNDLLVLADPDRKITALTGDYPPALTAHIPRLFSGEIQGIRTDYIVTDSAVFEFTVSDIVNYEGRLIGYVASGGRFSQQLIDDLSRLTGLDIILLYDQHVLGYQGSEVLRDLVAPQALNELLAVPSGTIIEAQPAGHDIVYTAVASPYEKTTALFVGSLEAHVVPIVRQTSLYVVIFVVIGGLGALVLVYFYTRRRLGQQVSLLVDAAERIARDDFDFRVIPRSHDELGYLAGEFEKMRARIVENRAQLEQAQEERVQSERLVAVGQLVAGIVHDFKNPMSVIRGTAEMIGFSHKDDDKLKQQCTTISDQIDRMLDLTRDILEYSRGRTALEVATVDIEDYFSEIIAFHLPAFQPTGVRLALEAGPAFSVRVRLGPAGVRFRSLPTTRPCRR